MINVVCRSEKGNGFHLTFYIILLIFLMNLEAIQHCPILYPSLKEFDNFREFMERLDQTYKKNYGMVKVSPLFDNNMEP